MACSCSKKRQPQPVAQDSEATSFENAVEMNKAVAEAQDRIKPTEQCIACAQKHMDEAWAHFHEYSYTNENRRAIRGNLRQIVLHTYKEWKHIAELARECALLVQEAKDLEAEEKMCCLSDMIEDAFNEANPEVKQRIDTMATKPDIIIPLGNGSRSNDDELRILLRSIDRNLRGYGRVFLVTSYCPSWVNRDMVTVVNIEDLYHDNKDANLHLKTLKTIEKYNVRHFVWCSDDNVFSQPMYAGMIPTVHNHRRNEDFSQNEANRWRNRVRHTLDWAESRGVHLEHNYECHCPQLFDGKALLEGMKDVEYVRQPGLTIYTTWRVVTDSWKDSIDQRDVKATYEMDKYEDYKTDDLHAKPFIGFNDQTFLNGLRDRLLKEYNDRSKFEL